MKNIILILFSFLPFYSWGQIQNVYASETISGSAQASLQGNISIASMLTVNTVVFNKQPARFDNFSDISEGKTLLDFASVTVEANQHWVLYAKLADDNKSAATGMTYSIKEKTQGNLIQLSNVPQVVLKSNNTNILNSYFFDLQINPSYTFVGGSYNMNIIFTVAPL